MTETQKYCHRCQCTKPIAHFRQQYGKAITPCKECAKKYSADWTKANANKRRETQRAYYHRNGMSRPMEEAVDSSVYLGVYVAERALSHFFDKIERMPYGNKGFDFLCGKGFKIDVKSSVLHNRVDQYPRWEFSVKRNKTADYFLCLAFDNRENLEPQHVWLIPGNVLKDKVKLVIADLPQTIADYKIYEKSLEKVISCCEKMKATA